MAARWVQQEDTAARRAREDAALAAQKRHRLELVDALLWQAHPRGLPASSCWFQGAWAVQAWHTALGLAMRALAVHVADTSVLAFQDTVPGPWQPAGGACPRCALLGDIPVPHCRSHARRDVYSPHRLPHSPGLGSAVSACITDGSSMTRQRRTGAGGDAKMRHREGMQLRVRSAFIGATTRAKPVLRGASAASRPPSGTAQRPAGWRRLLPLAANQMLESVGEPQRWTLTVGGVSAMLATTLSASGPAARDRDAPAVHSNSVNGPMPHHRQNSSEASSDSTSQGTSLIPAQNGFANGSAGSDRHGSQARAVRFSKSTHANGRQPTAGSDDAAAKVLGLHRALCRHAAGTHFACLALHHASWCRVL